MSTSNDARREELLSGLAATLQRRGLAGVGAVVARSCAGLGIVISQLLLIVQPLAPSARWRANLGAYALVLEDQKSWQTLIQLLEASDS